MSIIFIILVCRANHWALVNTPSCFITHVWRDPLVHLTHTLILRAHWDAPYFDFSPTWYSHNKGLKWQMHIYIYLPTFIWFHHYIIERHMLHSYRHILTFVQWCNSTTKVTPFYLVADINYQLKYCHLISWEVKSGNPLCPDNDRHSK